MSTVLTGRVLRAVGGFYRIALADGQQVDGRLSGRLKPGGAKGQRGRVLPGDLVKMDYVHETWLVEDVLPRATQMRRPAVANVELCVLVQSIQSPLPSLDMMDRILIQAAHEGMETLICISKADLGEEAEIERLLAPYEKADYPYVITSAVSGVGLPQLQQSLAGRVSTLAGLSGVGKSMLLNSMSTQFAQQVGQMSQGERRGKHTTRQVELLALPDGGWIADTPGFSTLSFGEMLLRDLPATYPDFVALAAECRFASCLHREEPGCAVQAAVARGCIDAERYQRYLRFAEEVETFELNRYKS